MVEGHNSKLSSLPPIVSSIPEFLDTKILVLENKSRYLHAYSAAIDWLRRDGKMSSDDFNDERRKTTEAECLSAGELLTLKRSKNPIKEDMSDEVKNGLGLQDAFRAVMVDRVRVATSQQKPVQIDRKKFRTAVVKYYSGDGDEGTWCHLTGWLRKGDTKACHLVPKFLDSETCSYLFGGDVNPATDVRNCMFSYPDIRSQETDLPSASFASGHRTPAGQRGYCYSARR